MANKPHLSPSQLDLFCKCGEAWRRRYLEHEHSPPSVPAIKGRGVHAGAQLNARQKIASHVDLSADDIIDASVAALEQDIEAGDVALSADERSRGVDNVIAEAKDDTAILAQAHAQQQAPDYQPLLVERRVRLLLPSATHDLLGYLDMVDDRNRVVDYKTTRRKKNVDEVHRSVQLTYYSACAAIELRKPVVDVRLDVLVGNKSGVKRQVITSTRSKQDYVALSNRVNAVLASIAAGNFPPAPPGAWWCSDRWCNFYSTCPYVGGH